MALHACKLILTFKLIRYVLLKSDFSARLKVILTLYYYRISDFEMSSNESSIYFLTDLQ